MATGAAVSSNDFYLWFYLTLKRFDDLTTKTVLITNRTLGAALSDTDSEHYPLITSITGIGSTLGDFLPRKQTGSILLDISPHSYGWERRFLDLLQHYTPIEQDITIYTTFTKADTPLTNPSATGTAQITSKVRSWSADFRSHTLELEVSYDPIGNRALGYQINATDNPDALASSLNRTVPVVVGSSVEAQGFSLNSDDTEPDFAFASNFGDDFQISAVNSVKVKNRAGQYVTFTNGSDATPIYSDSYTTRSDGATNTWVSFSAGEKASTGWEIAGLNIAQSYLINRIEFTFRSYSGVTPSFLQTLTCSIAYDPENLNGAGALDKTTVPIILGTSSISSADYQTQINSGSSYQGVFIFDPPVVTQPNYRNYFILTFERTDPVDFYWWFKNGSPVVENVGKLQQPSDNSANLVRDGSFFFSQTTMGGDIVTPRPQYKVYAVEYTPNLSTSNKNESGFGYSYISFSQYGTPKAVLTDEQFIVNCDGIKDDASGTITGSAGALIEDTEDVLKLITSEYDGANWNLNSNLDATTYATGLTALSTAGVKCAGRTSGRDSIRKTLEDVLYSTSCRIGLTSSGITIYPLAQTSTLQGTITDADCRIISLEARPADETILNKFIVNYNQQLSSNEFYFAANENDLKDFIGYYLLDSGSLFTNSQSLFGIKELRNNRFLFASDATHVAEVVARYARIYGRRPVQLVTFEVPFVKYSSMDVFQVWKLVAPQMPAYFGTSSDSWAPTYGGAVVNEGKFTEKRAEEYRVQIESKKLFMPRGQAPYLRITARVKTDSIDPI